MPIRILSTDAYILNLRTRIPFRYGIVTVTAVPHLFLRVEAEIDHRRQIGFSADSLAPKWFTKDPAASIKDDILEMLAVVESACTIAKAVAPARDLFTFWSQLYAGQAAWGGGWGKPPLLSHLGTSLVERALIDATCKALGVPFWKAVRQNLLGVELGAMHGELEGSEPKNWLPAEPLREITARHTVGMIDPLTDAQITDADRVNDGLPQSLEACIRAYGVTHFKIKLWGDAQKDVDRVRQIADVIDRNIPHGDYAYTFDANENFKSAQAYRDFWAKLSAEPTLARFLTRLIFVEQPIHRAEAMGPEVRAAFAAWQDRPPTIIDESDGEVLTARRALEMGYAGTSHKNCKGVVKGLANKCLIENRRRQNPAGRYFISGEDLSNVGPIALLQDLAVVSALGIGDVERNGHHYFRGLSALPPDMQGAVSRAHPDVYRVTEGGYPAVRIQGGTMRIGSVVDAPMGTSFDFDPSRFTPTAKWSFESL